MAELRAIMTDYSSQERAIRSVRDQVFLVEQEIDPALELDDRDANCLHAVVFADEFPVGTGRIDLEKKGKVGRVAVLKECRGQGVGRLLMETLENAALQHGLPKLWFHAQRSAVAFYLALDYNQIGDEFMEADIPHVVMEKELS